MLQHFNTTPQNTAMHNNTALRHEPGLEVRGEVIGEVTWAGEVGALSE